MESADWDQRYAGQELVWSAEPNRFVEEECTPLLPGRALDLAAGEGRNSIWLASRGWAVTAVDFSSVALDKGRRLAEAQGPEVSGAISWICADVFTWGPPAGAFDLVLVVYLQIPADQRRQVLAHAVTALAPGGVLLIVGHDTANLTEGVGGPQDARVLYRPEDLLEDLSGDLGAGTIVVERAETVRRPTPAGTALDALVRAYRVAQPSSRL